MDKNKMNEVLQSIKQTNELLTKILNAKESKVKMYKLTEGTKIQDLEESELLIYLNEKYNTKLKANGLKNLCNLKDVKTNSKYRKIFGNDFDLVLI